MVRLDEAVESQRLEAQALDEGLGDLTSQIAALREADKDLAAGLAETGGRLEAVAEVQRLARGDRGRRGWGARLPEASTHMAAIAAAINDLVREHQQLKSQVAALEDAAGTAARASAQASAVPVLRRDLRSLQEQLAVQTEAVGTLASSVERLRRRSPAKAPAAKRPARSTQG